MFRSLLLFVGVCLSGMPAFSATVLVLQFRNNSQYSDLNWVGESIAETLMTEFAAANQIVVDRASRTEAIRRLSLRRDAGFTRATELRLGQAVGADYLCFGSFDVVVSDPKMALKDSSVRISAQLIDLRKLHDGPEFSEAGRLTELSRLQEHLAYESLKYLEPTVPHSADEFLSPQKTVRLEAEESYVRGLLSSNREQRQQWLLQAQALDPKFAGPPFELGKLALEQKQYTRAIDWLRRIAPNDPNYPEARFRMGLAAYATGEFTPAAQYFREVAKTFPMSEVYNNLGAAENRLNQSSAAVDDLRRALEGDPNSAVYLFNLGTALLRTGAYDEAAKVFTQVVAHDPSDADARAQLDVAKRQDPEAKTGKLPEQRLKNSFNQTAFRQLKAMLQPESGR